MHAERLIDRFHRAVDAIPRDAYPPELEPVDRHVSGVAAFPAGDGVYVPCGSSTRLDVPERPVVLVGNHLDSAATYRDRLARDLPHGDPCPDVSRMRFWDVLYDELLDAAGVPRERLFVTNVHPALWSQGGASGNVPPPRSDPPCLVRPGATPPRRPARGDTPGRRRGARWPGQP